MRFRRRSGRRVSEPLMWTRTCFSSGSQGNGTNLTLSGLEASCDDSVVKGGLILADPQAVANVAIDQRYTVRRIRFPMTLSCTVSAFTAGTTYCCIWLVVVASDLGPNVLINTALGDLLGQSNSAAMDVLDVRIYGQTNLGNSLTTPNGPAQNAQLNADFDIKVNRKLEDGKSITLLWGGWNPLGAGFPSGASMVIGFDGIISVLWQRTMRKR